MWPSPAGTGRNRNAYGAHVSFAQAVPEPMRHLLFTPETSGGLLAAVAPERIDGLLEAFRRANEPVWVVGAVVPGAGVEVTQ